MYYVSTQDQSAQAKILRIRDDTSVPVFARDTAKPLNHNLQESSDSCFNLKSMFAFTKNNLLNYNISQNISKELLMDVIKAFDWRSVWKY